MRLFLIAEVSVSVLKESERPPGSSRYLANPHRWIASPFPHPQPDNVLYVVRRAGVTVTESGCYRYGERVLPLQRVGVTVMESGCYRYRE